MPTVECPVPNETPDVLLPLGTRHSPFGICRRRTSHHGLGLVELLLIVAVLAIGLAFIVSMARYVRSTSANEHTRKRMTALVEATRELTVSGVDPTLALPARLSEDRHAKAMNDPIVAEGVLRTFARDSSQHLADGLTAARKPNALSGGLSAGLTTGLGEVTQGLVGGGLPEMNDAWGQPIALMPGQHPLVGMAPNDGPFLVSAGPDGKFLTLADNLYSYDLPELIERGAGREGQGAGINTEASAKLIAKDP